MARPRIVFVRGVQDEDDDGQQVPDPIRTYRYESALSPDPVRTYVFERLEELDAHLDRLAKGQPLVVQHQEGEAIDLGAYVQGLHRVAERGHEVVIRIIPS